MPVAKDITNHEFGYWKALRFSHKTKSRNGISYFWRCQCKCGVIKDVDKRRLTNGTSKSCGCWRDEIREINIANVKFGKLTAASIAYKKECKSGTIHYWKFLCECGNEKIIRKGAVTSLKTTNCGCVEYGLPINFIPEGSRLRFIEQTRKAYDVEGKHFMAKAKYQCVCGNISEIDIAKVKNGHTRSCGCLIDDNRYVKHGFYYHPLYKVFYNIVKRCYKPENEAYKNYGARGVIICDEWLSDPISFIKWGIEKGWRKGLEVDKDIIPDKLAIPAMIYSPEMCCLATRKEQMNATRANRKITLNGVTKNLCQWSDETGIDRLTINARLKRGWSIEKALTHPIIKHKNIK